MGVLAIDAVDVVSSVSSVEASAAGYSSVADLMSFVDSREGSLYRIRLRYLGEDPRVALRSDVDVRRLKAKGLTESLETGYRLSPRGEAVLRSTTADR